jgi:hypothetical protein
LTSLDHTIREGNSIISDPAVHPKAFDWQAAFPEVFAQGGVSNVALVECASATCRRNWLVRRPGVSPPPSSKLPSKRWQDLILRVWHVDPLSCPVSQNPMRVIALIDDPGVVEKVLRHLGAWHDPPDCHSPGGGRPSGLSPPGATEPYTCEPSEDVDPMP